MSELVLGLDIGTASSKAVLCSPDGTIVARAAREHGVSMPRPGWFEHDAEATWWEDVRALCSELLAGRAERVAAVCVSGIGPCVVPCDEAGRPLRPAILYGVDTRADAEVAELTERLGAEAIRARGGSALSSQALGPKLLWLRRHEPETWERTRRWHMASSFAVERLTGEWVLDHHSASQCDPLYDLAANGWSTDWAEEVVGALPLPRLAWPAEVVGTVHAEGAAATGIPAGTPVAAGTIDAWAEAVSAGVRAPGQLMVMYGSTMFFVAGSEHPARSAGIWTTTGVDPGTLTQAAGTATSGSITGWLRDLVGGDYTELTAEAAAVEPGSDGLVALPYFAGERTPVPDAQARGVIAGLTLRHGRGHLYRAVLEATAYAARHNLEALELESVERVAAVGGGAGSELWVQIVSDVSGVEQEIPAETIGAAYGDARLAAEAGGLAETGGSWSRTASVVAPDPERRERYDTLYRLYRELRRATTPIQHALAAEQAGTNAPTIVRA